MSFARAVSISAILLPLIAGAADAQDVSPGRAGPPSDHGRWDPAAMRRREDARHAEHAKALHDVLGIQPSQEAAFAAFTASMTPPEHGPGNGFGGEPGGRASGGAGMQPRAAAAMTTPERLDRIKAEMDRRFTAIREHFDRRAQAAKALYAALDPHQRTVMDALPELSGHEGGMGRMGHEGRIGPRGPLGAGM